jgi:hypothetical protein
MRIDITPTSDGRKGEPLPRLSDSSEVDVASEVLSAAQSALSRPSTDMSQMLSPAHFSKTRSLIVQRSPNRAYVFLRITRVSEAESGLSGSSVRACLLCLRHYLSEMPSFSGQDSDTCVHNLF